MGLQALDMKADEAMTDQEMWMNGREQLSALADGELRGQDLARALDFAASADGRDSWHAYHVIGETLRYGQPQGDHANGALLLRLRAQIEREGVPVRLVSGSLQPVAEPVDVQTPTAHDPAANAEVLRWKMAAGFASLAAVAVLGWNAYTGLSGTAAPGAQMAFTAPTVAVPADGQIFVATSVTAAPGQAAPQQQVMIRDPRLDELLAAHRQLGNSTNALQMPAGFLRNANFAGRER